MELISSAFCVRTRILMKKYVPIITLVPSYDGFISGETSCPCVRVQMKSYFVHSNAVPGAILIKRVRRKKKRRRNQI